MSSQTKHPAIPKVESVLRLAEVLPGSGGHLNDVGTSAVLPSQFFNKKSLIFQQQNLKKIITTMFTFPASAMPTGAYLTLRLISGCKVLEPALLTSVNPAWRETYVLMELAETWSDSDGSRGGQFVLDAATDQKLKAMKEITPGMGDLCQ
ncbi:hypothetical protein BDW59DRAFT_164084 [Aspergillus cavernicola]|uniref:C2 domain-containing protein n=1 Tax=Aspergillus cavernicola TaxID=176166 RepID=A0ABR4I1X8_9EURO